MGKAEEDGSLMSRWRSRGEPTTVTPAALTLKAQQSHLALTVEPAVQGGHYLSTLGPVEGQIVCSDLTRYTAVTVRLKGYSEGMVYGKDRWQAAQVAAGAGSGGGMMPIQTREIHPFLEMSQTVYDHAQVVSKDKTSGKTKQATLGFSFDIADSRATHKNDISLPLPPTARVDDGDWSHASIGYKLSIRGERSGMLKLDDKLKLEIPLAIFSSTNDSHMPPAYASHTAHESAKRELTYKSDSSSPPFIEGTLSFTPPTYRGALLQYVVSIKLVSQDGQPPSDSLLASVMSELTILVSLGRGSSVRPIVRPEGGQPFDYATTKIKASQARRDADDPHAGMKTFSGVIPIDEREVSAFSPGVDIHYMLTAHLKCRLISGGMLNISSPILLPSEPSP
ncbi:uncharacterized protein L969DRAFT_84368 [Mixia osmundae IAM 14324]|uniref:Uncharacterized protein n=1 Tax=Mixia osmundae (strain CBS 9802 / IAM 14324 / JCM 22182 / KY 12970) TaxID=764103 RepID=G7E323_MIXOS|nr:uncharacterized protein L969DRAFT_84368 [Mixia osmundae IAM 14324]KEI42507.1 hypothetical protein L969DRAFT_84368 [Mixia osmundae IAM 14324]GAA97204.1 hypothetical protein E5Q_03880 [Mixia osmundae IAM 14324]